jgi:hypothetical protein
LPDESTARTAPSADGDAARPLAILVLIAASALGIASMVGGTYAIYVGTTAAATLGVFGRRVELANVGVALVAVGFVAEVAVFRQFLQYLERLAAARVHR